MANMSYCRFQNTLIDLKDCLDYMQDDESDPLSEYEFDAKEELIEVCKEIVRLAAEEPEKAEEGQTKELVSDRHGIYLPQIFVKDFYERDHRWIGALPEAILIVKAGTEHPAYWEAWDEILDSAQYEDKNGVTWKLWQDGSLFAYTGDGSQFT